MTYLKASELQFDPRLQMGKIFSNGFYQWLKYFSKDKEKLSLAMAHIFDLDYFYVAVENNARGTVPEVIAMTACTDGKTPPISLDKKVLCSTLGFIGGRIAFTMLNKHLVNHVYPFDLSPQMGSIEFVATDERHRGKGAALKLIEHIIHSTPYNEYVLEVADTNTSAIRLYEKLEFEEFKRTPAPKGSGFNHLVYMKKAINFIS